MRARLAVLLVVGLMAASCGSPPPSTMPESTRNAAGSPSPMPSSTATDVVPNPVSDVIGYWEGAGAMAIGRLMPHAVPLGSGSVLAVGNDWPCVREDSRTTEIWSPVTGQWTEVGRLNKARADLAVVALADRRVLVTGGRNASGESYSSTYLFDPWRGGSWTRGALLETARTGASAVTMADGRVLAVGGYYSGSRTGSLGPADGAALAAYRLATGASVASLSVVLADSDAPPVIPALATAEVYDPAVDAWTRTGSMRYARFRPAAVTLADGRVLVVGSGSPGSSKEWDYDYWLGMVDERAYSTAELYDPASGRFSLTGEMPPIDLEPLAQQGLTADNPRVIANGTLVPLADGGALLAARATRLWVNDNVPDEHGYLVHGEAVSIGSLRFDPNTDAWIEIDRALYVPQAGTDELVEVVAGRSQVDMLAVVLADGRVLMAGGLVPAESVMSRDPANYLTSSRAVLYDPVPGRWEDLPPMPEPRAGGAAIGLGDGSALLLGGYVWETLDFSNDCDEPSGLSSSIRFVPGPPPPVRAPLSGFGTATIDGVLSPGEWDRAAKVDFFAPVPPRDSGVTVPASLQVMNDRQSLYLVVTVEGRYRTVGVTFEFDNDDDGVSMEEGDDAIVVSLSPGESGPISLYDDFRSHCPGETQQGRCGLEDTQTAPDLPPAGTTDGSAAGSGAGGMSVLEIQRPLASGDVEHDFQLKLGDAVGFIMDLSLWGEGTDCSSGQCGTEVQLRAAGWPMRILVARGD